MKHDATGQWRMINDTPLTCGLIDPEGKVWLERESAVIVSNVLDGILHPERTHGECGELSRMFVSIRQRNLGR